MFYYYNGSYYCGDCTDEIRKLFFGISTVSFVLLEGTEFDEPKHCAHGSQCPNRIELADGEVYGKILGGLTDKGREHVKQKIQNHPNKLIVRFWAEYYRKED